jgi:hypothetical protein
MGVPPNRIEINESFSLTANHECVRFAFNSEAPKQQADRAALGRARRQAIGLFSCF